jgi:hypothetical protein
MEDQPYPFPVGDDPRDPDVLEYWSSVARRLDNLLLPRNLKGWNEFIEARVAAAAFAVEMANFVDEETTLLAARQRLHTASHEFARIKGKLDVNFISAFDHDHPALIALFARNSATNNRPE